MLTPEAMVLSCLRLPVKDLSGYMVLLLQLGSMSMSMTQITTKCQGDVSGVSYHLRLYGCLRVVLLPRDILIALHYHWRL